MTNLERIERILKEIPLDDWNKGLEVGGEIVATIGTMHIYINKSGYVTLSGKGPQNKYVHSNYAQLLYIQATEHKKNAELNDVTDELEEAFKSYKKRKI